MTRRPFERMSKRRRGFPSETQVKRGLRFTGNGKELVEKLGRNDLCPCGSGRRFQALLPAHGPVLTAPNAMTTSETRNCCAAVGTEPAAAHDNFPLQRGRVGGRAAWHSPRVDRRGSNTLFAGEGAVS